MSRACRPRPPVPPSPTRRRGCRGRRPPAARRRARHRQDQPRPVRHRPRRHALALRHAAQPVAAGSRLRRLQLGFGRCRVDGDRPAGAGHRHGRLGPGAGRVQQHRRPEAEPGARLDEGRGAGVPLARLRVDLRAYGGGRLRRARGDGRAWTRPIPSRARLALGALSALPPRLRIGVPRQADRHVPRRPKCRGRLRRGVPAGHGTWGAARGCRPRPLLRDRQAALRGAVGGRAHGGGRRLHRPQPRCGASRHAPDHFARCGQIRGRRVPRPSTAWPSCARWRARRCVASTR